MHVGLVSMVLTQAQYTAWLLVITVLSLQVSGALQQSLGEDLHHVLVSPLLPSATNLPYNLEGLMENIVVESMISISLTSKRWYTSSGHAHRVS